MSDPRPWFKAKTYGWGWGVANTWQGWVTYASFIALAVVNAVVFPPSQNPALFGAILGVLAAAALIAICLLKGEQPKWRWGR